MKLEDLTAEDWIILRLMRSMVRSPLVLSKEFARASEYAMKKFGNGDARHGWRLMGEVGALLAKEGLPELHEQLFAFRSKDGRLFIAQGTSPAMAKVKLQQYLLKHPPWELVEMEYDPAGVGDRVGIVMLS
ncbi:hypothetical protein FJY94_08110 [Candidatus Kaiserbacteria bacterium]|nr:hypothetical protein [Candidatus Kaiserbacteria bacterium]